MVEAGELLQLARERHGAAHVGLHKTLVDVPVTLCTGFRPDVGDPGRGVPELDKERLGVRGGVLRQGFLLAGCGKGR